MKIVKWTGIVLATLLVVLAVGGWLMSPKYTVTRSIVIRAAPDKVYPLVAEARRWKEWSAWNRRDPAMDITYSGPPSGPGAVWAWKSKSQGDGRMTFTAADPPKRVAYALYFPDFNSTSMGDFQFTPEGAGTRVTWLMNGDMGANVFWRWMTLFMDKMVGPDFDAGLANLKALAEKP